MATQQRLDQETAKLLYAALEFHCPSILIEKLVSLSIHSNATWQRVTFEPLDMILQLEDNGDGIVVSEDSSLFLHCFSSDCQIPKQDIHPHFLIDSKDVISKASLICDVSLIIRRNYQQKPICFKVKKGQVVHTENVFSHHRKGTTIVLENFFYSIPVRRQYLSSKPKELQRIIHKIISKYATMYPQCTFEWATKAKNTCGIVLQVHYDTTGWKRRLKSLWGDSLTSVLIPLKYQQSLQNVMWQVVGYFSIEKIIGIPQDSLQVVFFNDEPFPMRTETKISALLLRIADERLQIATHTDRTQHGQPAFFIHIKVPNESSFHVVSETVESHILQLLQNAFLYSLQCTTNVESSHVNSQALNPVLWKRHSKNFIIPNAGLLPTSLYTLDLQPKPIQAIKFIGSKSLQEVTKNLKRLSVPSVYSPIGNNSLTVQSVQSTHTYSSVPKNLLKSLRTIGIWNRSFILFWHLDTLYALDQHAAAERIEYETSFHELLQQVASNAISSVHLETQSSLLYLDNNEYLYACRYKELLEKWGWKMEPLFDTNISSHCMQIIRVPIIYETCVTDLGTLREQIQYILSSKDPMIIFQMIPQSIQNILATHACRKAIKFGDPLTKPQVTELVEKLQSCHFPFRCAHGRPSMIPLMRVENSTMQIVQTASDKQEM
eukprot:jgi/Galph1/3497/GphlegSOOS_G2135.1